MLLKIPLDYAASIITSDSNFVIQICIYTGISTFELMSILVWIYIPIYPFDLNEL